MVQSRVVTIIFVCLLFLACNNGAEKNAKVDSGTEATNDLINNAGNNADSANRDGARLIAANDCLTCHKLKDTSVGPSYVDVAKRYEMNEGNIENLSHSIIHGSVGIWGNKKMTPHANLDFQDAEKMVQYILSLKDSATAQ